MDCSLPGSSVHGVSPGKNTGLGCHALLQGIFHPGIKPRFPTLQMDSLLPEPPKKPMNTGVCSLSLLQGIFQTQESNQGLLHCRQVLYQRSYQCTGMTLRDGMGREMGGGSGWGIHVHPWLVHVNVWQIFNY